MPLPSFIRLNVRCCCLPQKILGSIDVPRELVFSESRFPLRRKFLPLPEAPGPDDPVLPTIRDPEEAGQIRRFRHRGGAVDEFAVYSDDKPASFWEQFQTFLAAPSDQVLFEEWARDNVGQPDFSGFHGTGGRWIYHHNIVGLAWRCWQAARLDR